MFFVLFNCGFVVVGIFVWVFVELSLMVFVSCLVSMRVGRFVFVWGMEGMIDELYMCSFVML